jgi:hypothetical protein
VSKPRFECDISGANRETVRCNGKGCDLLACLDCLKAHERACVERNGDRTKKFQNKT